MAIIGIDIDGVLADYVSGIIDTCVTRNLPINARPGAEPDVFNLVDAGWFDTRSDFWVAHNHLMTNQHHIRPFASRDVLQPLKNAGHTVIAVTARGEEPQESQYQTMIRSHTRNWIHTHIHHIDDIVFSARKETVGIDVLIDDYPPNVHSVISEGMTGLLIRHSYNVHDSIHFRHYPHISDAVAHITATL